MKAFLLFILFISFLKFSGFSQSKKDVDAQVESLKKEYKENDYVILEADRQINFELNKKTSQPIITDKRQLKFMPLKHYINFEYFVSYDENSEVDPVYIARDAKKKSVYSSKTCGNYEVDNIFYSDAKACTYKLTFLSYGENYEFGVNTKYNDIKYFSRVFFHESVPSEMSTVSFNIPNWMEVEIMEVNFSGYNIVKTKDTDLKMGVTKHTYKLSKLKGFDKETYVKGISWRYPHLLIISKAFTIDQKRTQILSTPNELYNWYNELVKAVDNNSEILKEQVNNLIKNKDSQEDKIKAIYYWVQDNIRYIAFEQGIAAYKPEAASKVFTKRYGDCKGMANLMKEMLILAGIDARITWIGTNDLPYSCSIPSLAVNNHMICTVFLNGQKYYLDATEKFVAFGDNAERIQGKEVMIENGKNFILEKVPVVTKENNLSRNVTTIEMDGQVLKGSAKMTLKGESKKNVLYQIELVGLKDHDRFLKYLTSYGEDKNLNIDNIVTSDLKERKNDLIIDYDFKIDNHVNEFANELYVDIDPYKQYKNFVIDTARVNDYYFGTKIFIKDTYHFKIPSGFDLKHLPENRESVHEEFSMKVTYKVEGSSITLNKEISIDNGVISKSNFETWNQMLKKLVASYNEQIVLHKK